MSLPGFPGNTPLGYRRPSNAGQTSQKTLKLLLAGCYRDGRLSDPVLRVSSLLAAAIERIRSHAELRRSATDQSILARELGHRVRNLLGLIRALASQTTAKGRTGEEFRAAFVDRIQALSVAESLVFEASDERANPLALAQDVLAPHQHDDQRRIIIDGAATGLSERQARMFGLALHELATNAAKHGALSVAGGTVRLGWHVDETGADRQQFLMTWQEADGPEITPPERKGFGTRLLSDVVAHELGGEAHLNYEPQGVRYTLKFPMDEQ
jgi:two-component sensor histidine kinase